MGFPREGLEALRVALGTAWMDQARVRLPLAACVWCSPAPPHGLHTKERDSSRNRQKAGKAGAQGGSVRVRRSCLLRQEVHGHVAAGRPQLSMVVGEDMV